MGMKKNKIIGLFFLLVILVGVSVIYHNLMPKEKIVKNESSLLRIEADCFCSYMRILCFKSGETKNKDSIEKSIANKVTFKASVLGVFLRINTACRIFCTACRK